MFGIFNVTHGAGATTACINLAKYFSLHGYITKVVDMSGTDALSLVEIKEVEIGIGPRELDYFKRESNALIMDFGTPYDITPKGDNFKISYGYSPEYIREFNKCNLKIIMGFSDKWNIGKIRFFLNNEQWREVKEGDYLHKRANIGRVGKTGTATGAFLHFEIKINGVYYDPMKFWVVNPLKDIEVINNPELLQQPNEENN